MSLLRWVVASVVIALSSASAACTRRDATSTAADASVGAPATAPAATTPPDATVDGDASSPPTVDATADVSDCARMRFLLASIINHNQYGRTATGALVVAVEVRAAGRKPERVYLPECNRGDYPSCFNFSACTSRGNGELTCTLGKRLFAVALERGEAGVAVVRFAAEGDAGPPPGPPIALPDLSRFGCFVAEPAVKGERVIYTDL